MKRFLLLMLSLAAVLPFQSRLHAQQPGAGESAESRLAARLCSSALTILRIQPITPLALETASDILREASALSPDDVEMWRLTLKVADLAENDELQTKAVAEIARLDPSDSVVALRRISQAIEQAQTVEQRLELYERLLEPKRLEKLSKPIASRLIFDYALLLRREGRISAFSDQLARAVAIDPSNAAAATFATGYFHTHVKDAFAESELLINLFLANPTMTEVHAALAQIALDNGAYEAAVRMYDLLTRALAADGTTASNSIVGDHAVALWGAGRAQAALRIIEQRQTLLDGMERSRALAADTKKTPMDVADVAATPPVVLASVRAAILDRLRDPHAAQANLAMLQAYEAAIERAQTAEQKLSPQNFAASYLELAMISLWMACDADRAESYVQQAEAIEPLTETAEFRFQGWIALCRGNLEQAVELFTQADPDDSAAQIGLAMAQLQSKKNADAARNFLAVARRDPGTLMGVWSANMLFSMVGQLAPISENAKKINALVASIPTYMDRFPERSSELLSMRLTSPKASCQPFEPVVLELEIVNNALFPLAISPTGPIHPQVVLIPSVRVLQQGTLPQLDNIYLDIDRRLRLEPKQRLVIPVDLRRYPVGSVLETYLLNGAFIRFEAIWNYKFASSGVLEFGLLGGHSEMLNVRVEGARIDYPWIEQSLSDIEIVDRKQDVNRLIMLSHLGPRDVIGMPSEVVQQLRATIPQAMLAAYEQLDPLHQALVLCELAIADASLPIFQSALGSEHRLVRLAYLLNCVRSDRDPMIDVAKRSDDPILRNVAAQLEYVARVTQQQQQQQLQQQQQTPGGAAPKP